jgi:hypothetical protein
MSNVGSDAQPVAAVIVCTAAQVPSLELCVGPSSFIPSVFKDITRSALLVDCTYPPEQWATARPQFLVRADRVGADVSGAVLSVLACIGAPLPGVFLRAAVTSARAYVTSVLLLASVPAVLASLVVAHIDYLDPSCLDPDAPDIVCAAILPPPLEDDADED